MKSDPQNHARSKNVGIYGGTFDPIHLGHVSLAYEIMESKGLDEVWFCPTSLNPLKKSSTQPVEKNHRLKMLEIALEGEPRFKISDIELYREGPSYTIDTLQELIKSESKKSYPHHFSLIMGEDTAQHFDQWREPEKILSLVPVYIGTRLNDFSFENLSSSLQESLKKGLTPTRVMEISSSEIRKRLAEKLYCGHLLQKKVLDYIILNHLYL